MTHFNPEPLDPRNVLIVDGLNLAFRWKHSGNFIGMQEAYIDTVKSLAKSYDCGRIVILSDAGSSWRVNKFPAYKKARKEKLKHRTESQIKEDENFFEEYDLTLNAARERNNIFVFRFPGVEADDLATYIVENKYMLDINDIWLISSDKDWDILVDTDVSRFSTVTRTEITVDNWPYDVPSSQYVDYQVLIGDQDVPGIYGVGPVKAKALLDQYDNVIDLYCSLPLPGNSQWVKSLNSSKELLPLYLELMDFKAHHEEAIGEHLPQFKEELLNIFRSKN